MTAEIDYSKYNFPTELLKFDRDQMNSAEYSVYDNMMQQQFKAMAKLKDDFIKGKLIEKGFEHLIEGMEKRRFPKICIVKQEDWTYIYADNDTDEGFFIVAMQDYNFKIDGCQMKIEFRWQDTLPLIIYNGQ